MRVTSNNMMNSYLKDVQKNLPDFPVAPLFCGSAYEIH